MVDRNGGEFGLPPQAQMGGDGWKSPHKNSSGKTLNSNIRWLKTPRSGDVWCQVAMELSGPLSTLVVPMVVAMMN